MVNTLTRLGVANATTDGSWAQDNALFQVVFTGEILERFNNATLTKGRVNAQMVDSGKSHTFLATGGVSAGYHVPGTLLTTGSAMPINEITVKVDDLLLAYVDIADIDQLKSHYDSRRPVSNQLADALAQHYDVRNLRVACKAARSSAVVTGQNGGSQITAATAGTDGEVLVASLFDIAQTFDEKNVDKMGRSFFTKPAQYYLLGQTTKVLNRDWGGMGSFASGSIGQIAGLDIIATNNLPSTNVTSATTGEQNDYTGDFRYTVGVAFTPMAVGSVIRQGLQVMESGEDFRIQYQATRLLARLVSGSAVLRPDCAVEIITQ